MTLRLSKHHSNGNDFLVALVSEPHPGATAGGILADPAAAAVALCHRRRGVGADGLVLGIGSDPVRMRLWNSDGSEAEISGNGLRCLAQALTRGTNEIDIEIDTPAGPRRCQLEPGADPGTAMGRVEMGAVTLDALDGEALDGAVDPAGSGPDLDRLPAALALVEGFTGRWRSGSVGNPHMVVEVADPDEVDLEAAGPAVEACFVGGANAHFAAATSPRRVRMRIWERGAGVTEACGSGAAVAAAAFAAWGWDARTAPVVETDEVIVAQPGGETRVHLGPPVALTGPVVHVADIEIEIAEMPGMAGSTPGHWSG